MWHSSFSPFLDEVVRISGLDRGHLKEDFRKIHQKYGTSEYGFRLRESELLKQSFPNENLEKKFYNAILREKEGRDTGLALYPSVIETLWSLKKTGVKIVAYTDSMGFYITMRLKRLGLDGLIDVVYTTKDHEVPETINVEEYRSRPAEFYELQITENRSIPQGEIKPNPRVLLDIVKDLKLSREECLYIGDSLDRDIAMAQDAGIDDVWAEYGKEINQEEYELLREVSHWSDDIIKREKQADQQKTITPTYQISKFSEVLDKFEFAKPNINVNAILDVWKQTVTVQQHFNDIEMKIRNLFVTIFAGLVAVYGYFVRTGGTTLTVDMTFGGAIIAVAFLFYFVDLHWYHRLLVGSVKKGMELEKTLSRELPGIELATQIKEDSSLIAPKWLLALSSVPILKYFVKFMISDRRFYENGKIHSDAKIEIFYKSVISGVLLLMLISGMSASFACLSGS